MKSEERRRYRRLSLRLPIARLQRPGSSAACGELWTTNISAGGMYFRPSQAQATGMDVGCELLFELTVPPGEGYSPSAGAVRGAGRIVRTDTPHPGTVGIALEFHRPLAVDF